ncbi:protein adenylyltransferase SelO [Paracoccus shanxieyensis]|uniref:Protein nucleotidyltransferase YdiU n=1 Tax=Paracoccus shanxieyensis TaxID=2675752 RepID=A0A6L6ISK8_9RHOB|nr:YdiU family protein [Paracoccus shanxieyensis]MTH63485.1 YdiU family protein [Paracoccus shanxieyensis]MTH86406.1 YdiU family protein [Paracoccus shanxieyensis]
MIQFDNSYARLPEGFFTRTAPTPVRDARLVALNRPLAERLGLDADWLAGPEGLQMLAGNALPDGAEPIAQAYAGHQFGGFSPQLGDGRAVLLGEIVAPDGIRFDIQLKGAGPTPFSRRGDGRAWLGPVLREYLVSEFMAAFGIPTTRALAAVSTGEQVIREQLLPGAVLTRVASSHIRVGTFEFYAARGDLDRLRLLAQHVMARHYPDAKTPAQLLQAVVDAQAATIAGWMGLGFIHGVMNTDNMSVSGETIDYGPCAFMDGYKPAQVFSSIDAGGRYAWNEQPNIAVWNLAQLASCLVPLMGNDDAAVAEATRIVHSFPEIYKAEGHRRFAAKLGISTPRPEDQALIDRLLDLMAAGRADFTRVFAGLSDGTARDEFTDRDGYDLWARDWQARIQGLADAPAVMARANPRRIPRNHRIEQAIAAARDDGDFTLFHRLDAALRDPFTDRAEWDDLAQAPLADEIVQRTFCGT